MRPLRLYDPNRSSCNRQGAMIAKRVAEGPQLMR